jgi:hypothetical protein
MNKMTETSVKEKRQEKEEFEPTIEQKHYGNGDNVVNKTVIDKSVSLSESNSGIIITGDNNTVG